MFPASSAGIASTAQYCPVESLSPYGRSFSKWIEMKAGILRDSIKHPGHNCVIDGGQSRNSRTQDPGRSNPVNWRKPSRQAASPGGVCSLFVWVISRAPTLSALFTHWFSLQDSHWHWMDGANLVQNWWLCKGYRSRMEAAGAWIAQLIFRLQSIIPYWPGTGRARLGQGKTGHTGPTRQIHKPK